MSHSWFRAQLECPWKKPLPILAFPSVSPLGVTVRDMVFSSDLQAKGLSFLAEHTEAAAMIGFMDLSVEAECFGTNVRFSDREVPTVVGCTIRSEAEADALAVPPVGAGRSGVYLDTAKKAKAAITDRPFFAGMIGPFSLAARLIGVSEIMLACFDEPDMVCKTLEKATRFLTEYAMAYRASGADGIMIAEPVSGLLSPAMEAEFSAPFVKRVVNAVRNDTFCVIYHNCGNNVPKMLRSIYAIGADAYHFGNSLDLCAVLDATPPDVPVMGNVDPAGQFCMGTPDSVREATRDLLRKTAKYRNFILSSGCDIPPATPWENIRAFFDAAKAYGENRNDPGETK